MQATEQTTGQQLRMVWPKERLKTTPRWSVPEEYVLRTFRGGDEEAHVRLMRKAGFSDWKKENVRGSLPRCLSDGFFVIEHKTAGRLVATAMAVDNAMPLHPSGGELGWVAADPEHRGKGLGYCVSAAVTARFLEAGYKNLFLRTDDFRLPAIKTYLKLGWIPFLFTPDMEERWGAVCEKLGIDFESIGRVTVPFSRGRETQGVAAMTKRSGSWHSKKRIRVGVVGVGRGMSFARGAPVVGMELVALCDIWEEKLREAGEQLGVTTYPDFDTFLEHDMDAVVLANYFHEHAPLAIKGLERGLHVMSETMACKTPAEGVALARAVKKSDKIYMFAENYPFFAYNQEMRRLYRKGEIGEVQYAEGEYNHPFPSEGYIRLAPGINHWRNWLPSTYYSSHALGPIMCITDTHPVRVNALSIAQSPVDEQDAHVMRGDPGSVILCRMNNGSVARVMGLKMHGHSIWYRIHGTRGLMENMRTGDTEMLRVKHEAWDKKRGEIEEKVYRPEFPEHATAAKKAGHAGGDFFTNYHFADAIRRNEQPYLDVYRALEMAMVSIQSWRSALADGAPFEIPNFRAESARRKYAKDDWSPWPEDARRGQPPPSVMGSNEPAKKHVSAARKVWTQMGYRGD